MDYEDLQNKKHRTQDLNRFADVPLCISVELGNTCITLNDLLQIKIGTVIELQKLAGEPLEMLINDRLVARGEVVIINDRFGIRLTDILRYNEGPGNPGPSQSEKE